MTINKLFIAEKPDMGSKLANSMTGNKVKKQGFIEVGSDTVVTWAIGHLLELAEPGDYDEKYNSWNMADLPILPKKWLSKVSASKKRQFDIVKDLLKKAECVVNAGDPDAEGQLIIDEILEYVGYKKPVQRILLNALDDTTIKRALMDLRDNKDFVSLKIAAQVRSKADWLIGMNASRAFTLAVRRAGHDTSLPIGRVKTPTLALVVRREAEIANFKSQKYYLLKISFTKAITATWQPKKEHASIDHEGRLTDKAVADEVLQKLQCHKAKCPFGTVKTLMKENKSAPQPLSFSLSALQLTAGRMYDYDPQKVLDIAQQLYDKGFTSYPRSDCEYLPTSQFGDAVNIIQNLKQIDEENIYKWAANADLQIKSLAWNDKKITAHHGIIPTQTLCNFAKLSVEEQNIYRLVARQYIAQFYPEQQYTNTKITLDFAGEDFFTSGNTVIVEGWKALFNSKEENGQEHGAESDIDLPHLQENEQLDYLISRADEKQTVAPKRFTPYSLLDAMVHIDKYVKNPKLKKQLRDASGIGTEATRAGIIKDLQDKGFITVVKKQLQPTAQGNLLISLLPDAITYPDFTAEWEERLNQIKQGSFEIETFMNYQKDFIQELCNTASGLQVTPAEGTTCPVCNKSLLKRRKGKNGFFWGCASFPECSAAFPDEKGKPQLEKPPEKKCECGGTLYQRKGKNGKFWSCNRWKEGCKITFDDYKGKPDRKKAIKY